MESSSKNAVLGLVLLAVLGVQGCAMSPGMRMEGGDGEAVQYKGQVITIEEISYDLIGRLDRERRSETAKLIQQLAPQDDTYRIGPTDILQITVWDHPELTIPAGSFRDAEEQGQLVGEDGTLFYPFVGEMQVAGRSVGELRKELTQKLSRYIQNPQLDVRVVGFRSQKVYVVGEVRQPGVLPLTDLPMTIADAINLAGGVTPEAHKGGVNVSRDGQTYRINLRALYELADTSQNLLLQNGDIVNVPDLSQQKVFVMGEVRTPGAVDIINGRLTLAAALGETGGANQAVADTGRIYVVRNSSGSSPQIFHLDASYATGMLLAEQFEMEAQDVIFVDTAGLSRWNRVISQLLPSAQIINYGIRP